MFACTKFRRNRSRVIGFRTRKPPQKFDVKEVAFNKYHKKYFTRLYISRSPFIPTNPLLVAMGIFPFSSKITYAHLPNGIPPKKQNKLHHMCYCDAQTMQTKFARFCQKKLWMLNWTPQRFGQIDVPDSNTPAKTLTLRVFIGQGANCEVLDARLKFIFLFPLVLNGIKHGNASSQIYCVMQLFRSVVSYACYANSHNYVKRSRAG